MSKFTKLWIVFLGTSVLLQLYNIDGKILRLNQCRKFDANFSIVMKKKRLTTKPIETKNNVNLQRCIGLCILNEKCQSMNYQDDEGICELLQETTETHRESLKDESKWEHYETDPMNKEVGEVCETLSPCPLHFCEDICESPGFQCHCLSANYTGIRCNVYHAIAEEKNLLKDNFIYAIPKLRNTWSLSFDIKPVGVRNGWSNIVHSTIGNNRDRHGDRTPAIFFNPSSTALAFTTSVNENPNYHIDGKPLPLNYFTSVKVSQTLNGSQYVYSIWINGSIFHEVVNTGPRVFNNVQLYAADPWYEPGNAFIKNLLHENIINTCL